MRRFRRAVNHGALLFLPQNCCCCRVGRKRIGANLHRRSVGFLQFIYFFLFFVAFIHSLLKALAVRIRLVGGSQHDNKQEGEKKGKLFEGLLFFGMKRTTQRRRRRRRTSCVRPVSQDLGENRPGAATQTLGIFAAFVILFYSRRDAIPSLGLIYS